MSQLLTLLSGVFTSELLQLISKPNSPYLRPIKSKSVPYFNRKRLKNRIRLRLHISTSAFTKGYTALSSSSPGICFNLPSSLPGICFPGMCCNSPYSH